MGVMEMLQDVMEPLTMVAPPAAVKLRIKGFDQVLLGHTSRSQYP